MGLVAADRLRPVGPENWIAQFRSAAYEFERASCAPWRCPEGESRALYRESTQVLRSAWRPSAAMDCGRARSSAGTGDSGEALPMSAWHQAQEHRVQADAAGRTGRLLHEAVEVTPTPTPRRPTDRTPSELRHTGEPPGGCGPGTRPMAGVVRGRCRARTRDPCVCGRVRPARTAGRRPAEPGPAGTSATPAPALVRRPGLQLGQVPPRAVEARHQAGDRPTRDPPTDPDRAQGALGC